MANDPGRKDREAALYVYMREHFPPFAEWSDQRHQRLNEIREEAQRRYPEAKADREVLRNPLLRVQHVRENLAMERRRRTWIKRQQNTWEIAHPNPLTREKRKELEAAFSAQYAPTKAFFGRPSATSVRPDR